MYYTSQSIILDLTKQSMYLYFSPILKIFKVTVGADERGYVIRTKEHFISSGFLRKSEWGAFAYLMKVEGMKKI
jgi:hypothetical protein